jgi:diguanylate cyclase (GGDEF)-like protein
MNKNRHRLRLLYIALCAAQLLVTGLGLAVAYQVQRSYSRTIDYEKLVSDKRRAIDQLTVYARSTSPESLDLDDQSSGPAQLSQIQYAAKIFLRKNQDLLDEAESAPDSPLARADSDLQELKSQMEMLADQSRLAGVAWQKDSSLARARMTYASRASTRVQTILGDINQEMTKAKDDALAKEGAQAARAHELLKPLAIVGIFLILPALLYARGLDRKIWEYEAKLEEERNLLEERVTRRTGELRTEIDYRKRVEAFNASRNLLLERVAQGTELDNLLLQLAQATEDSVPESRCVILVKGGQDRAPIAPNLAGEIAARIDEILPSRIPVEEEAGHPCFFLSEDSGRAPKELQPLWSQGYRGILAVPVNEAGENLDGMIALLLRKGRGPGSFEHEVLLSARRVASVALQHNRMQDELFRRAHYDSLTGLPNRALLEDRLQQAVALAQRRKTNVGVLCIDLDGFKQVNDEHGHHAGDWLLQEVANRLRARLRSTDTMARQGGDEFVAILHEGREGDGLAQVSEDLVNTLAAPYMFGNIELRVTASIGVAVFPTDGPTSGELRRNADLAMYRAKERGGNTYQIFSADIGEKLARRKQIEQYLHEAMANDGFELYYQPIYTVARRLMGLEALIRFRRQDLKSISPAEFIRVAEQTGEIGELGDWVLREACRQVRQWQDEGFTTVPVAVNVSALQIARHDFAAVSAKILQASRIDPRWIHIEITETAIMSDFEDGRRQLCELAESGLHISIDDFGTGQSSLSYIHKLPIRTLKIDRSFVQQLMASQESEAIVRAIIAMGQSLSLTVVAEGVETEEQLRAITVAGCDAAQGYLFSKPMEAALVGRLLGHSEARTQESLYTATEV